ncbi:ATP-binding protein [Halomicrobium salinisoli]|uniref:ATP-binding protein n=1 Tax=Halomicrobium salinisoli TaxID=2878391 RepID=UPI003084571B
MAEADRTISLTEDDEPMPLVDVVTGRGFVTGKSGSGKSNTASVLAEELLSESVPLLIVDTDGEYYGLKERYELLHVGGDDHCDAQVGPRHADKLAEIALDRGVPIILDVSGFVEASEGRRLVHDVLRSLFVKEKEAKTPFLVLVEEAHEFMPQSGGLDELGEMLIRIAKRGRKRGLGICAMSQRPSSVEKDYITQCDWLVWHRLTWENDTDVVARILGRDAADEVQTLDPGEAILMTDWDERHRRVRFRRKETFDAGATPGLDGMDQPDLTEVETDIVGELRAAVGEQPSDGAATGDAAESDGGAESDDGGSDASGSSAATSASGSSATASSATAAASLTDGSGGESEVEAGEGDAPPAADDPLWEVAEFVAYLVGALGAATVRLGATVERAVARQVGAGGGRPDPLDGPSQSTEGRPVVGLLVLLAVLAVGVLAGLGAVTLLG